MRRGEVRGALRTWIESWIVRGAPSAIYGTVVGGAVMAAGDEHTPIDQVAVNVVLTLVIYWLAERWSQALGTQIAGEPLEWRRIVRVFVDGLPMVQVSFIPLLVMVIANVSGADADLSVNIALLSIVALLFAYGAVAARRAGLSLGAVALAALTTGALGGGLIVLKSIFD